MKDNQSIENKLVIVAGVGGEIGRTYFNQYIMKENTLCYGIGRRKSLNRNYIQLDMLDKNKCLRVISDLDIPKFKDILYIHAVGIDKFEPEGKPEIDKDGDGIDDEVYASNFGTFRNFGIRLMNKAVEYHKPITVCNIGSLSDAFLVPLWKSFSACKNALRTYMRTEASPLVTSIFFNVSSTGNEKFARIYADTTYWLTTEQLLERSLPYLENKQSSRNMEINIFNHNPNYTRDYYIDHQRLKNIWKRDMGYSEKEKVPLGLRI